MAFEILHQPLRPVPRERVGAEVRVEYNRVATAATTSFTNTVWDERRKATNADHLFNGTKFRLHRVVATSDAESDRVMLQLGITDYKALLATNNCIEHIRAQPEVVNGLNDVDSLLSQALGVEALVVTADEKLVLFRRSKFVAEMPGWWCCPGGHCEPSNVVTRLTTATVIDDLVKGVPLRLDASNTAEADAERHCEIADVFERHADLVASAVVAELFESIVDEVCDETGAPRDSLVCEGLCGIVANVETRKPDAIFIVRCSLSAADLDAHFKQGGMKDAYEADGDLLFVAVSDAEDVVGRLQITPPSLACIRIEIGRAHV